RGRHRTVGKAASSGRCPVIRARLREAASQKCVNGKTSQGLLWRPFFVPLACAWCHSVHFVLPNIRMAHGVGAKMNCCIWNTMGGVGKTFLTFTLANEHASRP
ncbi:MAG: hypothetical protein IJU76_12195, partial [Desulfovibrionaceae bacterium]|nr:hypothetical protein [Desulfovibrionaceae bacterium]